MNRTTNRRPASSKSERASPVRASREQREIPLRAEAPASAKDQKFAEPVSLSSTHSTDFPLPGTAAGIRFDLLALRARRKRQGIRGHVLHQEVLGSKCAEFADIELSTFPQQMLQPVDKPR